MREPSEQAKALAAVYRTDPELVATIEQSLNGKSRCYCGCGEMAAKGKVYAPGHAVTHKRALAQLAHCKVRHSSSYLPPVKPSRRRTKAQARKGVRVVRERVALPEPRPSEAAIVARYSDSKLRAALLAEGPVTLHERSGARQRSMAAAIVAELDRRELSPITTRSKRMAQARKSTRKTTTGRKATTHKETKMTTTKATTSDRNRANAKAAAERAKAAKATTKAQPTKVSARTEARAKRLADAKAAAKQGKDAAAVLAQPLPPKERKTKGNGGQRKSSDVPADLAEFRGNYSAPADMTQKQADDAARKLTDEVLAKKLRLMAIKRGGFRQVEKSAFLTESARRFEASAKPASRRKAS